MEFDKKKKKHSTILNGSSLSEYTESQNPVPEHKEYRSVYFFDFMNQFDSNQDQSYEKKEIKYFIKEKKSYFKTFLVIKKEILKWYGKFLKNWEEYFKDGAQFWYNPYQGISTWENPYFVLLCLVDNQVDKLLEPTRWQSQEKDILRIDFVSGNSLLVDKHSRQITDSFECVSEEVDGSHMTKEQILNELKKESLKKSMTDKDEKPEIIDEQISLKEVPKVEEEKYAEEILKFKSLLKEKKIGIYTTYDRQIPKLIHDNRYIALPKALREKTFTEFQNELVFRESKMKEIKSANRKESREAFKSLLKSSISKGDLNLNTSFYDFEAKFEHDQLFSNALPVDREFLFNEVKLKLKKLLEEKKSANVRNFNEMLRSTVGIEQIEEETTHKEIKKLVTQTPEYKLIPSSTERKQLIQNFLEKIKKLKPYKISSSDNPNEWRKLETAFAEDQFMTMLSENIKSEASWEWAKKNLCDDIRWKDENLNEEKKMELFKEFNRKLRDIKLRNFSVMLEERIGLNQDMTWHAAQMLLQNDPRYKDLQPRDRETLYNDYMVLMQERITKEFEVYLNETNLLNKDCPTDGSDFANLVSQLNSDVRCQRLSKFSDKRNKLIRAKIKSLKFMHDKQMREQRNVYKKEKHVNEKETKEWRKGDVI